MSQPASVPATFMFTASDLYERAGFERGELFRAAFPALGAGEIRELLVHVLQRHVIPALDQTVQTQVVPTVQNPLRATDVDGVAVRWTTAAVGQGPVLSPATVSVTGEQVLAAARRLRLIAAAAPA